MNLSKERIKKWTCVVEKLKKDRGERLKNAYDGLSTSKEGDQRDLWLKHLANRAASNRNAKITG